MTRQQDRETAFLTGLASFERCLMTPVIPGELPGWLLAARDACRQTRQLFRAEVDGPHSQLLREIVDQDSELVPRAEELRAEDTRLLTELDNLHVTAEHLCELAERAEPNEARLDEHVEDFTASATDFVMQCRRHEIALTTWFMEAFNRDRGIAD